MARGGINDSPPSDPSSVRISGASMSVEPLLGEGSAEPTGTRTRQTDEDVPQTVVFNGKVCGRTYILILLIYNLASNVLYNIVTNSRNSKLSKSVC